MDHIDIVKAQGGYKVKVKKCVVLWKIKENLLKIRKLSLKTWTLLCKHQAQCLTQPYRLCAASVASLGNLLF